VSLKTFTSLIWEQDRVLSLEENQGLQKQQTLTLEMRRWVGVDGKRSPPPTQGLHSVEDGWKSRAPSADQTGTIKDPGTCTAGKTPRHIPHGWRMGSRRWRRRGE
jgi:hypothetical protein